MNTPAACGGVCLCGHARACALGAGAHSLGVPAQPWELGDPQCKTWLQFSC